MTAPLSLSNPPRGIDGLTGREPIACALTIGIKGENGAPTEKDRFHILDATPSSREFTTGQGKKYTAPVRYPHPSFALFNGASAERRQAIPARLAHATVAEMFEIRRQAQNLPGNTHPKKAPVCIGNGIDATRWDASRGDYVPRACPGDRCEFTQPPPSTGRPQPAPCKPFVRLLARFDWPATADGRRLPNVPFKFTTGGWNSAKAILGFFESFERNCRALGVDPAAVPLFGLPVLLSLTEKTNPETKSRFPVVSLQINGDVDFITWIEHQLRRGEQVRALAAHSPLALTDSSQQEPDEIAADYESISAGAGNVGGR